MKSFGSIFDMIYTIIAAPAQALVGNNIFGAIGLAVLSFDWKIFSRNFRKQSLFGRSADRYGIERRNLDFFRFQLNKQLLAGQIWCGRRKIKKFLDLVIKSHVVVPIWSRKRNFFSKMEAKRRFLSLYVVKGKKAKHFCNKSSFSGLIWSERGKK